MIAHRYFDLGEIVGAEPLPSVEEIATRLNRLIKGILAASIELYHVSSEVSKTTYLTCWYAENSPFCVLHYFM